MLIKTEISFYNTLKPTEADEWSPPLHDYPIFVIPACAGIQTPYFLNSMYTSQIYWFGLPNNTSCPFWQRP